MIDHLDEKILRILQNEAQISNTDLARKINLSPPATHSRVKRLEKEGYIEKYVSILNNQMLGFDLTCFIFVSTNIHQREQLENLEGKMKKMPEILECHCLTGEHDYLLKVVIRGRTELEAFIRKLNLLTGIIRIQTSLSLREIKFSTSLPLFEAEKEN